MAYHFSANQYEDAFRSKKLRNWTVPRKYKEHPATFEGYTQIIATNRGHLLEGVPRSKESAWGTFMGTWDMPLKIPPVRPCYTARSKHGAENLRYFRENTSLNCAVNGYKPFKWEKTKRRTPKRLAFLPPTSVLKSPEEVPQPSGLPKAASAKSTPRKSASPAEPIERPPAPLEASPIPSLRVTPRNLEGSQPPSRPPSKPGSVLSGRRSAGSNTKLMDDNSRPSPTPSLKSDVLPELQETGRPKSGGSLRKSASPRAASLC